MFSKILVVLASVFSAAAFAANVPASSSYMQFGGVALGSSAAAGCVGIPAGASGLIELITETQSSTAGNKLGLYQFGVQYQVPAGKTLYCPCHYTSSSSASAGQVFQSQHGHDTASFSNNSAKVGTDVYYAAGASGEYSGSETITNVGQFNYVGVPYLWKANTYPFYLIDTSSASIRIKWMCFAN